MADDIAITNYPVLMTADQLRHYLGGGRPIGEDRLRRLIDAGLPYICPGSDDVSGARRLFHRGLVEDWIREQIEARRVAAVRGQGGSTPSAPAPDADAPRAVPPRRRPGRRKTPGVRDVGGRLVIED